MSKLQVQGSSEWLTSLGGVRPLLVPSSAHLPLPHNCPPANITASSAMGIYLMPMLMSARSECSRLGATYCYLSMPKTGSSSMKAGLGLPTIAHPNYGKFLEAPASLLDRQQRCRQILLTFADPVKRFFSGLGTVHARCGTKEVGIASNGSAHGLCNALNTMAELEAYVDMVLARVSAHMLACTSVGRVLGHLLPQALIAAAVPRDATLLGQTVQSVADYSKRRFSTAIPSCTPKLGRARNEKEGLAQAPILAAISGGRTLPPRLLRRVAAFYAPDYAWLGLPPPTAGNPAPCAPPRLRLLRADGGV